MKDLYRFFFFVFFYFDFISCHGPSLLSATAMILSSFSISMSSLVFSEPSGGGPTCLESESTPYTHTHTRTHVIDQRKQKLG